MEEPAQSVRMPPGSSTVTLMPSGATSCASTSEKPPTAHFAAWYADRPGVATRPPSEETWMMWPLPCSRSIGRAALLTLTTPSRLVSSWARKSAGVDVLDRRQVGVAGVVDHDVQPAEGRHRRLHRPLRRLRVGDVQRDREHPLPVPLHQVASCSGRRAVAATRCPASSAASTISRPSPRELPVTRPHLGHDCPLLSERSFLEPKARLVLEPLSSERSLSSDERHGRSNAYRRTGRAHRAPEQRSDTGLIRSVEPAA